MIVMPALLDAQTPKFTMSSSDHVVELGWLILHEDSIKVFDHSVARNMVWASRLRVWAEACTHSVHHLHQAALFICMYNDFALCTKTSVNACLTLVVVLNNVASLHISCQ